MRTKSGPGRLASAVAAVLVVAFPLPAAASAHAAAGEAMTVDLSSSRGPSTGVGEGFLYGISQDGSQPADQYLQPLGITAFRGGGWFSGGWIRDNYQNGSATKADVNSIIAQARRLTQPPYHAQYQVLVSDIYGANGGQPSNTMYPCDNGNCSNWISFIDATVGALQGSGLKFAYDIWNEPDISAFWTRGVSSPQYFQMWDTAYREIRRLAPGALIVGPSLAFTPDRNPAEWNAFLSHTKAAGTVPDEITNHDEGDGDDPVQVGQSITRFLANNGLSPIPLSANEYQPADRQTAGVTAWYVARFAQSSYVNAMRGNWVCCVTPNLTGILTQSGGNWLPTGHWWVLRDYADMTGTLANTSGQVGSTAISAAKDSAANRAVAVIGDEKGYTGPASVAFTGLASVPWLAGNGSVHVVVQRIPDQAPLSAPQVVLDQTVNASGGSVTVPFTFQASHDAFAIYLTPTGPTSGNTVTVTSPGNQTGTAGTAISGVQVRATDSGSGQSLTYAATGLPPGLSINAASGLITGTPTTGGTYDVTVTATDTTGASGAATFTWTVSGGTSGFPDGYRTLVTATGNLCLDVYGNSSASGAVIDQWTCTGQSNQQFQFVPESGGYGELRARNSGQDVSVAGGSTAQGVPDIVQQPGNGSAAGRWLPQRQSDGSWQFKNQNSGLCLDVYGASGTAGQQLDQWPCKNAPGTNQDFSAR
ncbi:RICIN domain-containing protein [Amycolatopsis sp. cmx-4-68]|uniref:RICIN domain-containing protein n=1 Tax=Amycolatopsis sp. cmx-4-68 TaxID=2790938 RepID=UPI00397AC430